MREQRRLGRPRRLLRAALGAVCVVALAATPLPSATADGDGQSAVPSRADVRDARQQVATRADQVGQIQAQLALAQQRLQQVQVASMQATEAYNGAVYRLQQARAEARAAERRADLADREVERQRRALEGFAVGSASDASSMSDLSTLLSSGGPEQLLQDYRSWSDTTSALQSDLDSWDASRAVAEVLREQADAARERRAEAADAARAARDAAQAAVAAAEQQEASIQAETDQLVRELAAAQQVSVQLARERQVALAEAAEQAAQEAAEQEAAEQAAAEAAAAAAAADDDEPTQPQPGAGGNGGGNGSNGSGGNGGNAGGNGNGGSGGAWRHPAHPAGPPAAAAQPADPAVIQRRCRRDRVRQGTARRAVRRTAPPVPTRGTARG